MKPMKTLTLGQTPYEVEQLPVPAADDNGKVAEVYDGKWTMVKGQRSQTVKITKNNAGNGMVYANDSNILLVEPCDADPTLPLNYVACKSNFPYVQEVTLIAMGRITVNNSSIRLANDVPFVMNKNDTLTIIGWRESENTGSFTWREKCRTTDRPSLNMGVLNAKDFGAVGDGKTDDTDAIQAAVYAAEATKRPLYIPAGEYVLKKTINTHKRASKEEAGDGQTDSLCIYGSGMSTVFKATTDFVGEYVFYIDILPTNHRSLYIGDFALNINASVSGIFFKEIGMKGVVENLWIRYYKELSKNVMGIYCESATVVTFSRIKVWGKGSQGDGKQKGTAGLCVGSETYYGSHSVKILDCDIVYCKWAMQLYAGSNWTIENCRIDENYFGIVAHSAANDCNSDALTGIRLKNTKGTFNNCTIRCNRFESNTIKSIVLVGWPGNTYGYGYHQGVTIEKNYFSGLGDGNGHNSWHTGAIFLAYCDGITIAENLFKGKEQDTDKSPQNIECGEKVYNVHLRGNVACLWPSTTSDKPYKSNVRLGKYLVDTLGLEDNIEVTQDAGRR